MNNEIFELSEEEINSIAGGALIDPPVQASSSSASTDGLDIPQIDNNPPA